MTQSQFIIKLLGKLIHSAALLVREILAVSGSNIEKNA